MGLKTSKRVFIALELPEDLKEKLHSIKGHFEDLPAKWVEKENIHLTLFFLGKQPLEKISLLQKILEQVNLSPHLEIKGENLEWGPPGPKKRLLWVRVKKSPELVNLYRSLFSLLQEHSFPLEKREFLPHITLARLKSFWQREYSLENLPVLEDLWEPFSVPPVSLTLFESHLTPKGPIYHELYRVGV